MASSSSSAQMAAGPTSPTNSSYRPFILQRPTNVNRRDQLPSFWRSLKIRNTSSVRAQRWRGMLRGWRLIVFHSWLNLLLVFVPVSWALEVGVHTHSVKFALCVLGLIPLVKLHDLCTNELALRIGGNKTGLMNASLSNMVEVVISISALRRCELRVVQSALVGSILSKMLLVLGLCFFAGGMRFSEQGFDATATQMHTSLLSISVGAILLPAAYHFALEDRGTDTPTAQSRNILRMSHGVSIVLLIIYSAYLVFQLWSHKHFYHNEHDKKSRPLPVQVRVGKPKRIYRSKGKETATSFPTLDPTESPGSGIEMEQKPYNYSNPSPCDSQLIFNTRPDSSKDIGIDFPETPMQNASRAGIHLTKQDTMMSIQSSTSTVVDTADSCPDPKDGRIDGTENRPVESPKKESQLSWTITLGFMIIITTFVAVTAESLVASMDGVSSSISKEWIGLIVLPSVSAIAECITAVKVSVRDELTLSVSVAVGSSIQTALCVFPFMIILAWITQKPLSLLLDPFQSLVLYLSVQIMSYVVADGRSNWLEGVMLICLYVIVAVSFWFYPGSSPPAGLASCIVPVSDPM